LSGAAEQKGQDAANALGIDGRNISFGVNCFELLDCLSDANREAIAFAYGWSDGWVESNDSGGRI